ncbi:unnamed protein product (macronuclear) [Paramecium tetraurelia]|uniref:Putative cathepsin L 3 n=1 Tax=Paramecium tetraurelia TaxID=5888 RepID=CATL3_PARTE|nr:uncharacterized protein GSPATT00022199001 [Paramecium tetraurelia]Q94715.2 RecName: Full=Putative cathepsin L 3; Flags: Precursor [Paramecium tetraurelia]CAK89030.1 unnamed protein product [Paramecium tetraurelia]|eukprot:XP_001456427.1 hypothetical protein (macronuclear) [Paramecium tetraurelia strain d4-2]
MKQFLTAAIVTLLMTAGYYHLQEDDTNDFERWALKNNKFYTESEKLYRMEIYNSNKRMIEEHNQREDVTYQMGENQFMTLSHEEFVDLYLQKSDSSVNIMGASLPEVQLEGLGAVDWRNYTTVKEQGQCASGWAFSVSNSLEAWYAIRGFQKINASTQQIVDCDYNNTGCSGGYNAYAMEYVLRVGLVSSTNYPYVAKNQTCKQSRNGTYFINGYSFVGGSQSNLQYYLNNYPISVGVEASNWQFYRSGLFSNCSSNGTNHYALAVGFDSANNWIVQNSWGTQWGESGNIRLYPQNTCGILNYPYQVY